MSDTRDKKIASVSWEQITLEAIEALSSGRSSVSVPASEIYRWIESTEYLTEWGRSPDPNWTDGKVPSYMASLQHQWQRMVAKGTISRDKPGVYRLPQDVMSSTDSKWKAILEVDEELSEPVVKQAQVRRVQRSQKLRDLLVNYYDACCQICEDNAPFFIPTEMPGRYHVEVHHVDGLAESFALKQMGMLVGFRVNGLGNLTVLCPHHHAVLHYHWPRYEFDRQGLFWKHEQGGSLHLRRISNEHANLMRSSDG